MAALHSSAQQTPEKFIRPVNYLLYFPDGYREDTLKKWPLILFLHGSGERGDDLEKVKTHGPPKLITQGKKFPFIIISPQVTDREPGWSTADLYALLGDCKQRYRIDPDRVYLTGLSMGGFGTWSLAIEHPEEFAAIIPICGGGDTTNIWKLRNMPVWCFHGAKDGNVPLALDQEMINALHGYNPSARFTIYPEAAHDCWTETYQNDSIYQWLLQQKKFAYMRSTAVKTTSLEKYSGTYVGIGHDTVFLQVKENALLASHQGKMIPLSPASDTVFFIDMHEPVDIHFVVSAAGRVIGFIVFDNRKTEYKKIL